MMAKNQPEIIKKLLETIKLLCSQELYEEIVQDWEEQEKSETNNSEETTPPNVKPISADG